MYCHVRAANYDMRYQPDYSVKEINIGEFPDDDPWSEEGTWDIDEEGEESDGETPIAAKPKQRPPKGHVEATRTADRRGCSFYRN